MKSGTKRIHVVHKARLMSARPGERCAFSRHVSTTLVQLCNKTFSIDFYEEGQSKIPVPVLHQLYIIMFHKQHLTPTAIVWLPYHVDRGHAHQGLRVLVPQVAQHAAGRDDQRRSVRPGRVPPQYVCEGPVSRAPSEDSYKSPLIVGLLLRSRCEQHRGVRSSGHLSRDLCICETRNVWGNDDDLHH